MLVLSEYYSRCSDSFQFQKFRCKFVFHQASLVLVLDLLLVARISTQSVQAAIHTLRLIDRLHTSRFGHLEQHTATGHITNLEANEIDVKRVRLR